MRFFKWCCAAIKILILMLHIHTLWKELRVTRSRFLIIAPQNIIINMIIYTLLIIEKI